MNIKVGTSGFQYPEWKGLFYPETMPVAKMLPYYAEHFATTEINYTFRQIPSSATLARWDSLTPPGFTFSLKAPQKITHWSKLKGCASAARDFYHAVSPLGKKLGPVLFQLPPNFHGDASLLDDFLAELPAGLRAAFEFRHESWFTEEIFALLKKYHTALCLAESDELATPFVATAPFGYLRLRRTQYAPRDLGRWAKWILENQGQWKETFAYFKHEETGSGPAFAEVLLKKLRAKA